eukprot:6176717-Heterocapsa_arctica.AAC.1
MEKEEPGQDGENPGLDLRRAWWPSALPEWGPGADGRKIKVIKQPKEIRERDRRAERDPGEEDWRSVGRL